MVMELVIPPVQKVSQMESIRFLISPVIMFSNRKFRYIYRKNTIFLMNSTKTIEKSIEMIAKRTKKDIKHSLLSDFINLYDKKQRDKQANCLSRWHKTL